MSDPSSPVSLGRDAQIALITIDHPPVNALSKDVRAGLLEVLDEALGDADVRAIVLSSAGASFCSGADIREFEASPQPPHLTDVIQRFEDSPKPVVVALRGSVLGGGCELAAGCHYRIAQRDTRVGLPEVNLGLLPGAGGTQRLPRLIGFNAALDMMLDGKPHRISDPALNGFADHIVDGDAYGAARAFARDLVEMGTVPRRTGSLPPPEWTPEIFERHSKAARKRRGELAPEKIVAAVRRATDMPFADAVAYARADFLVLKDTAEAAALRHAFFAERAARKPGPEVALGTAHPLARAAVVGAGTMGQGIAIALLDAGLEVVLIETNDAALARAKERLANHYQDAAAKGRIDASVAASTLSRLVAAAGVEAAAEADVVIEAVFEDIAVKREVFERLDGAVKPGTLLATNTSYLDVAEIARFTRRPQDVIGLHFFSPANVMRLLEIVRTDASSADAVATGVALGKKLRKVGVVCKGKDGFVGNRMLVQRTRECLFMLEEGATPREIDAAFTDFGFAMGPLAVSDLAGLDIGWRNANLRHQLRALGRDCDLLDRLVDAGRLGQKTRAGWYRYEEGSRAPVPDPAVDDLLAEHSSARGIERCPVPAGEILERCLFGMINEAARIIDEGVVSRPSDIDAVWLTGYGFPRHRGGPLYYADRVGLAHVLERIEGFRERFGAAYWSPAPLLAKLASSGRGITSDAK